MKAFERLQIVRGRNSSYLGFEVEVMHGSGKVFGIFQLAFHERRVDDHLRGDVGEFATLPGLNLFAHRLEVALHPINTDRDAVDERERL